MQHSHHILAPFLLASCLVACSNGESRTSVPQAQEPARPASAQPRQADVAPPLVQAAATPASTPAPGPAPAQRIQTAVLERQADGVQDAPMGHAQQASVLANMPGYQAPDDPEAASTVTGRRDAPVVEGEFEGGVDSAEELAITILDAIRRSDKDTMHRVRMTSSEFATYLWPEFPESRPVTNIRASDAWEFLERRNLAGVTRAFDDWKGRTLTLDRIEYKTGRATYRNFTLYEDAVIVARDEADEEVRLTFARAFVERHGRWKVYTYRD